MKVRDTVRVKANRMLGTVLQIRGEDRVRVVIGNRPARWLDEWIALLEKDPHAPTPGWWYAKGELEVIPRSEPRGGGDAPV